MSSVYLHPRPQTSQLTEKKTVSPLPQLLQTPSGLAVLELQGTINLPEPDDADDATSRERALPIPVGRLGFPDYNPEALDPTSTAWMKRVYMFIGEHQRLLGEVKKLPKPLAVVRRYVRQPSNGGVMRDQPEDHQDHAAEELEVVEIVKYKLVFAQRPEPITKTV